MKRPLIGGAIALSVIAGIVAFGSGGDDPVDFEQQAKQAISAECHIPVADLTMSYRYVDTSTGGHIVTQTFEAKGRDKVAVTVASPGTDRENPSVVYCG